MLFGELVQRDRERAGLTQEQFAVKLNTVTNRPMDPFTKKAKTAHRTWIAKVESGKLQRDLRVEVREWLARELGGDLEAYRTLPLAPSATQEEADALEKMDRFILAVLKGVGNKSQLRIDTPPSGPLASEQPHLLSVLACILALWESDLIIYSNEFAPEGKVPPNTMQTVVLLYALVGELAESVNPANERKLREHFEMLDWDNDIIPTTNRLLQAKGRGEREEEVKLSAAVLSWLKEHLIVYVVSAPPPIKERHNPLTNVLAESAGGSKRWAYALSGHAQPLDLPDASALVKAFDVRRPLFKKFQPTPKEIAKYAESFGLKLKVAK